jgi:hypothetical protein
MVHRVRRFLLWSAGLAAALPIVAGAAAGQGLPVLPFRSGTIAIRVNVSGEPDFTARVGVDSAVYLGDSLAAVRGSAVVRAAGIRTGIGLRDARLRGDLDVKHHPWIRFDLERVRPDSASGDTTRAGLDGVLTIRGQAREVTVPATVVARGDSLEVVAVFTLDIRDYGMKPPSILFGLVRVRPVVALTARLLFAREP